MASSFGDTVLVQSRVLGDETIITVRRQSVVGAASAMIVVALLPLTFGSIIATTETTLAVQSGLFVISPVSCIVTGTLVLIARSKQDCALMNKAMIAGAVSALASCVAAILFLCDVINFMGNWDVDFKVKSFSGFSFVLSFFETGLSLMISTRGCTLGQNSANAFTVARLSGTPTVVTTQTLSTNQTPPTTQQPPPTGLRSPPSASWSHPHPSDAPPPPYEKPPNYNSILR